MPRLLCCPQVVKELTGAGSQFRVLALSATPGNDLKVDLCLWSARGRLPDLCLWSARGEAPRPVSVACKGGGSQPCVCGLQRGNLPPCKPQTQVTSTCMYVLVVQALEVH